MLKNFLSFKKISHFICNFISLICSFQQCQCCECENVSMGFWKSRVKQKSFVKSLVCDSWLNKTFVSLVISKTPYSHFLLTAFTQCFTFTPQANFPAQNLNFHLRWRWWDQIQATFKIFSTYNPKTCSFKNNLALIRAPPYFQTFRQHYITEIISFKKYICALRYDYVWPGR